MNSNFSFTVKVGQEHFAGHFNYHQNGAETVKMSFRRVPHKNRGMTFDKISYLRNVNGQWRLWDITRKAPKNMNEGDKAAYAVFREAYGLAMLAEAQ
jgi:hypothetical protein